MRPRDWRSFLTGAALGIAAVKLAPVVKQAARPVARTLVLGALNLSYEAKALVAQAKEEFGNMVAEAQFESQQAPGGETGVPPAQLPPPQ